jgi:hypothetical protein
VYNYYGVTNIIQSQIIRGVSFGNIRNVTIPIIKYLLSLSWKKENNYASLLLLAHLLEKYGNHDDIKESAELYKINWEDNNCVDSKKKYEYLSMWRYNSNAEAAAEADASDAESAASDLESDASDLESDAEADASDAESDS